VLRSGLKLSRHVSERIGRRELDLGGDKMQLIENAVDKAAAKGARESLVLLDNLALVVSVKNRTVITAMDKSNLKEGVFTQIDSAVII
jgi:flagellar operon protein